MSMKCLLASLVGALVVFLAGWILYGLAFGGFFAANAGSVGELGIKDPPAIGWIALGAVFWGGLLATVLGWRGATTALAGAKTGAVLGFLVSLAQGFTFLGGANISTLLSTLVDPFVFAAMLASGGAATAAMLGRGSEAGA